MAGHDTTHTDLTNPPRGAWFSQTPPHGFEVGVSTRSAAAFLLVPITLGLSVFTLGGVYGTQIDEGKFNLGHSLSGIPFLLGMLFFGSLTMLSLCGKIVVKVEGNEGSIFTGVGPIGWRRRFNWSGVTSIRRTERHGRPGSVSKRITLDGEKRIHFAAGVKRERLDYLFAVLRRRWRE